jgi:hypothetical protein
MVLGTLAQQPAPVRDGPRPGPAGGGVVRGRVLTSDTDVPIRDCLIDLIRESDGQATYARTGLDGRFELTGLAPGIYRLVARPTTTHAGYLASGIRHAGSGDGPHVVEVVDGRPVADVVIRLVRGAAIGGRVIDDRGEPVAFIEVHLGRPRDGELERVSANRTVMTDDLGRFRVAGLAPGTYVVVAEPMMGGRAASADPTSPLRTYYPTEPDHTTAQAISLTTGQDIDGLELRLLRGRLYRVAGRILDSRGQPAGRATGYVNTTQGAHELRVLPDGSFSAANLPPGRYSLRATLRTGSPPATATELGAAAVEIADADVDDVTIALQPAATATGTVVFEEAARRVPFESIRLRASPFPRNTGFGDERAGATPDRMGAFTLTNLHGPVLIRPEARDLVLVHVRLGDVDITDVPTDFKDAGGKRLEVALGIGASAVTGRVTGRDGRPEAAVSVRVFAQERERWDFAFTTTRTVHTGLDGRFVVKGLRPGRYYAAALTGETYVADSAAYFERLARSAVPFELGADGRATVDLTLDDRPKK